MLNQEDESPDISHDQPPRQQKTPQAVRLRGQDTDSGAMNLLVQQKHSQASGHPLWLPTEAGPATNTTATHVPQGIVDIVEHRKILCHNDPSVVKAQA